VRQLEAIVRVSESLAKLQLQTYVSESHTREAIRLFETSTLASAHMSMSDGFADTGTIDEHMLDDIMLAARAIMRYISSFQSVSVQTVLQHLTLQQRPHFASQRAIEYLVERKQLRFANQKKTVERI
jgi:DNA replication licensing factor MCM5